MLVRLLGDVQIRVDDQIVPLRRAGERCVLATLAFHPRRPVNIDTLIENVWGDRPPEMAGQTIASYLRAVRRAITEAGGGRDWLVNRRPRAYELRIAPDLIDYHRFQMLCRDGRTLAEQGDSEAAVVNYEQALALWQGEPLGDLTGDWAAWRRQALHQEYLDVLYRTFDEQIRIGDCASVVNRTNQLVGETVPTDRLIELAIRALAGCGQKSLIPQFLERVDDRLHETVGARVSAAVRRLGQRLVTGPAPGPDMVSGEHGGRSTDQLPTAKTTPPSAAAEEWLREAPDPLTEPAARPDDPTRGGITMTAMFNGRVAQAAGDQYITED